MWCQENIIEKCGNIQVEITVVFMNAFSHLLNEDEAKSESGEREEEPLDYGLGKRAHYDHHLK